MANFALLCVAGFVAPRHLRAIKENGGQLIAAMDPHDSVGVLDGYFPGTHFFTEFERFDRHIDKLRRSEASSKVDYTSICSPNYLHDAHMRHAIRSDCDAICEKPLVLNPSNLSGLRELERETGRKVHAIPQLRVHPAIQALRSQAKSNPSRKRIISLAYITSRGNWYLRSWKGDDEKSGGVVTNIGIHFFDMLQWIYGDVLFSEVHHLHVYKASGYMELSDAEVCWFQSVDERDLPVEMRQSGQRTFRNISVDGREIEFSEGFNELHTESYQKILAGESYGIEDARPSIELVHDIRNSTIKSSDSFEHPFLYLARKNNA